MRIAVQEIPSSPLAQRVLSQDIFLKLVLQHLVSTLQNIVGLAEAEGLMTQVSQHLGEIVQTHYLQHADTQKLSKQQVLDALIDFEHRVGGDFYLLTEREHTWVLGNRCCPFGDMIHQLPTLCMVTSNIFGVMTAENLGYANVRIDESFAQGHQGCRVTIRLDPEEDGQGRDYFATQ